MKYTCLLAATALLIATSTTAYAAHGDAEVDKTAANPPVSYPEAAQRNNEQGVIRLLVKVDRTGKARAVKIAKSSGFDDLDTAAAEGVLRWHYWPASYGSEWADVQVIYQIPKMVPVGAATPAPASTNKP